MMTYFIQVSVYWLLCLALYGLLLGRDKMLVGNRFYLLFTLISGLIFPLLNWPAAVGPLTEWAPPPAAWLPEVAVGAEQRATATTGFSGSFYLALFYGLGCLWALGRLGRSLWLMSRLIRESRREVKHGRIVCLHPAVHSPFSWFGWLFWSETLQLSPPEEAAVLAHEQAHIRQRHSLDVLLLEVIGIFFWWNPLWYAYDRALRAVHEYQADAAALGFSGRRRYSRLLVRQLFEVASPPLTHAFHSSQLKRRIAMMTKTSPSGLAPLKYLLLLPVLALALWACGQEKNEAALPTETAEAKLTANDQQVYKEVDRMPVFGDCAGQDGDDLTACSMNNLMQFVYENMKYPEADRENKVEGMTVASFVVTKEGKVEKAEIIKSVSPTMDAEILRVVRAMPTWRPGEKNGELVSVEMKLPVKFQLPKE